MCRKITCILLFVFFTQYSVFSNKVNTDRWLEIDLYWFEKDDIKKSVEKFWERYYPLMEGVQGWKGIILNVGWLSDYILEWKGDVKQTIKLPENMKKYPWFKDGGQLTGNTIEQIKLFNHRFENADPPELINYETWTYSDLKRLASSIKNLAKNKYQLRDVKVGTFVIGWENIYDGDKSIFITKHPNIFVSKSPIAPFSFPNLIATLSSDDTKYGAFPSGISEGLPFTEFFGKQWGSLSKTLGLDAIVLRDSYLGVGIYDRAGPYGLTAPADSKKAEEWNRASSDLVRHTKMSNPNALVIGYSNGASAVADWRVNCMDLESIAKEGYLDAWIDQTWAGAWNEVGQRPGEFWNWPTKGWTYQLSFMLVHAAVLAESNVRHYFLTETYDAWESWNVIHNAKERLRWAIWAYSHAAVKTPNGLKMPSGSYISWCNKGKDLLSEEDVAFLKDNSNAAINDANSTTKIYGPTPVYCRSAMEWQMQHKPNITIKEWIDEQIGTLIKWSVPVLSITRSEYLPQIESDMFIFQTPVHLKNKEKAHIMNILKSGKPSIVVGSPVGGLDEDISKLLGVQSNCSAISGVKTNGTMHYQTEGIYKSLPNNFPIWQLFTQNKFFNGMSTIYSVDRSPCLGINNSNGKQLIFWDPPEFSFNLPDGNMKYLQSLDMLLGSPVSYVLIARLINETMKNNNCVFVDEISIERPVNLAIWHSKNGGLNVLVGNLEEGINHTADRTANINLNTNSLFKNNNPVEATEIWSNQKYVLPEHKLNVFLDQGQTKLFNFKEL
jgi:hypothetical protein